MPEQDNDANLLNQVIGATKAFSDTRDAYKRTETEVKRLDSLGLPPKTVDRQTVEHRESMVTELKGLVRKVEASINTMSQGVHKVPRQLMLELETMKSALRRLEGQNNKTTSLQGAIATKGVGMFQTSTPSDGNKPQPTPSAAPAA